MLFLQADPSAYATADLQSETEKAGEAPASAGPGLVRRVLCVQEAAAQGIARTTGRGSFVAKSRRQVPFTSWSASISRAVAPLMRLHRASTGMRARGTRRPTPARVDIACRVYVALCRRSHLALCNTGQI